jgi:hypothetical protein
MAYKSNLMGGSENIQNTPPADENLSERYERLMNDPRFHPTLNESERERIMREALKELNWTQ